MKAELVIRVGATYEGDYIIFELCQFQIGITALSAYTGTSTFTASTQTVQSATNFKAAVDEFLSILGCTSDYTVTRSSNVVTITAVNDGSQYNFGNVQINNSGTQGAGAPTVPFTVLSQVNGIDPPQCCVSINSATQTADDGSANGTITINNFQTNCAGGTPSGFESQLSQGGLVVSAYTSGKTFWSGLSDGLYTIRVRLIAQPDCYDDYAVVVQSDVSCDLEINDVIVSPNTGSNDGSITVTASSSAGGLTYSLNEGTTQGSNVFTGLIDGNYTIEVYDSDGCVQQQPVSITYVEPVPESPGFDPEITLAKGIPYRFVLNKIVDQSFVPDNKLYCQQDDIGLYQPTFQHYLKCNDRLTLHLRYVDTIYNTVPRVIIRDYKTDEKIGNTLQMSRVGDYFYLITELSTIVNICEKVVYLQIISYRDDTEYFVHATSEPIEITDKRIQPSLYIRYQNGTDFAGIKYSGSVYYNEIRLESTLRMIAPKTETNKYRLSDGEEVITKGIVQYLWQLNTNFLPYFMHKILALAFLHNYVSIDGIDYVIEEDYTFDLVDRFAFSKGQAVLIEKENFQQNLL